MSASEITIREVLAYLAQGSRSGPEKSLEKFLEELTDVERNLKMLLTFAYPLATMTQLGEAMPHAEWIVLACDAMLQEPDRWDAAVVARMLHRAMMFATGRTLVLAEIVWMQRLDDATRAIASSSPISLSLASGNGMLYTTGVGVKVFCWKGQWPSDNNMNLWRCVPVSPGSQNFYVVSDYTGDYRYLRSSGGQSVYDVKNSEGISMKSVSVLGLPDDSGIWRLVKSGVGTFTLCNIQRGAFLASLVEAADGHRRNVGTTPFHPLDVKMSACREWKITSVAPTQLEQGLKDFFAGNYIEAVKMFTEVLATPALSATNCTKIVCYRMAANLILQNEGCFKEDIEFLNASGGFPDYFFGALARRLSDEDKRTLEERPELNLL